MTPYYSRRIMMQNKLQTILIFTVAIAILYAAMGCTTKGVYPGRQCLNIYEGDNEKISVNFMRDNHGCIIQGSVKFYRGLNCTGEVMESMIIEPEPGFVFASSTSGGCPQLITVTHSSPACVTITLKSGRKVKVCY
jgi:hypothetical protein